MDCVVKNPRSIVLNQVKPVLAMGLVRALGAPKGTEAIPEGLREIICLRLCAEHTSGKNPAEKSRHKEDSFGVVFPHPHPRGSCSVSGFPCWAPISPHTFPWLLVMETSLLSGHDPTPGPLRASRELQGI